MKKIILISGASSGLGKETAKQLISEGYIVYVAARRVNKMKDLEEMGAIALKMDITKEDEVQAVVKRIISDHNRIDVLVNNAGFAVFGAVEDVSIDEARRQFEVNNFGLARLTQLVLPHMRARKSGTIINMSSMGGKIYTLLGAWYHASKHALEGWSDCLRIELKKFNINVVIIEPGTIFTEFAEVMVAPLLKRSGEGPYAKLAESVGRATVNTYTIENSSPPSVIAKVISKAIRAKHPKTRYAAGKFAKLSLFIRRFSSDRFFDWILLRRFK